ncbi:MAG: hypothetical protein HW421_2954 [Ignavibacteria bacterium]|nr:hypothetical protein [Ignavibacteria bacterium]
MKISDLKTGQAEYSKSVRPRVDKLYVDKKDVIQINKPSARGDKLELSADAKRLRPVMSRMNSGFYNNPGVLREVSKKISNEIPVTK